MRKEGRESVPFAEQQLWARSYPLQSPVLCGKWAERQGHSPKGIQTEVSSHSHCLVLSQDSYAGALDCQGEGIRRDDSESLAPAPARELDAQI